MMTPTLPPDPLPPPTPPAAPAPAPRAPAAAEPKKVLIVDDSPESSVPLARLLNRLGMNAFCAQSGAEALAMLEGDVPDLMILDVMMPEMDGMEVLKRVRENPRTAELPVVMFSAITDREFRASALQKGANDYWVKAALDFGKIRGTLGALL